MASDSVRIDDLASSLEAWAFLNGDADFAIIDEVRLSYAEAEAHTKRLGWALLALGVQSGDRVAVLSPPRLEPLLLLLACQRIGAVFVGLNPRYTALELTRVLEDTSPKVVFKLKALTGLGPTLHGLIEYENWAGFQAWLEQTKAVTQPHRVQTLRPDDLAALVFTSGSTGLPKAAMLPRWGLVRAGEVQAAQLQFEPDGLGEVRQIVNLPINHVGWLINQVASTIVSGGCLVLLERFDSTRMLELVLRHRVTVLLQVPTILHALTLQPNFDQLRGSSLRLIVWGGGRATEALVRRLQSLGVHLRSIYGQTETLSVGCVSDEQATLEQLSTSIGRADRHLNMRVVNENGLPCDELEVGELQVKADFLMLGYWRQPEATLDTLTSDGWLRTGDLASLEPNGLLRLVGRRSEMIKSGGYNLYPRELEEALETHPGVGLAAVIGIPDEQYGEVAIAYFEPRPGVAVAELELRQWCRERLANFKVPKRFKPLEHLPLLPNGKLDKFSLRALEVLV